MKVKNVVMIAVLTLVFISCKDKQDTHTGYEGHEKHEHHDTEVKVVEEKMDSPQKLEVAVVNEKDPVCQMNTAEYLSDTLTYKGEVFGFCSSHCKSQFKENPNEFVSK